MEEEFLACHTNGAFYDQGINAIELEVIQLKENSIPRGLVPLEELFDQDDVVKKPTMVPTKAS